VEDGAVRDGVGQRRALHGARIGGTGPRILSGHLPASLDRTETPDEDRGRRARQDRSAARGAVRRCRPLARGGGGGRQPAGGGGGQRRGGAVPGGGAPGGEAGGAGA